MVHLDLECVESFLALVEEEHYGRAAARLHVTSPALTKRIQRLEHQVGVRLLERGPAGVLSATPAGVRFGPAARLLLEQARAAHEAVRPARTDRVLYLGVPDDGGAAGLRPHELVTARQLLSATEPGVQLVCRRLPFRDLGTSLLGGRVDVQLTSDAVEHRAVQSTPVSQVARVAAVSVRHELADAEVVDAGCLSDLPMLYDPCLPPEFMRPFYLGDLRPARAARLVAVDAPDGLAVLREVARATGVTVLLAAQASGVGPLIRAVPLVGAPLLVLHAAHRVADRRPAVLSLVRILAQVKPGRFRTAPADRTGGR